MQKLPKSMSCMKNIRPIEYAATFFTFIVPGFGKRLRKYDQINIDTHSQHFESESKIKDTENKLDASINKLNQKLNLSDTPSSNK